MNVLITSAAAKVLLVRAFQAAVREFGGRVIAADIAADNAALFEADVGLILPRSDAPSFAETLERAVQTHRIGLIVPTRDGEIPTLASLKERFAGIGATILAPSARTLEIVQDKRLFNSFCLANGFPVARVFAQDEPPNAFPAFLRPATGAGGRGVRLLENFADWTALGSTRGDFVIQELVQAPEYTIDVLMDLAGRPIDAVTRRRLVVEGGEAKKSRVELQPELRRLTLALAEALGLIGHNVVQAFVMPDGTPRFIEINPRFGGASNLSIAAGLDSPRRIIDLLMGNDDAARRAHPICVGLTMLRHNDDRLVSMDALVEMEHPR